MCRGVFVTGTDTGVGKTYVATALLGAAARRGLRCAGMKPVASGAEQRGDALCNDDALRLSAAANVELPYADVNPYVFASPIAPHLAADAAGARIDLQHIAECYARIARQLDWVVVEGAGGWLVPLNGQQTMADLAGRLELPILLVVGMRLGCINHALLTAESILRRGQSLAGWVANVIDPSMEQLDANLAALRERVDAPLLTVLPHVADAGRAPEIDIEPLLGTEL